MKQKIIYRCSECAAQYSKWVGKCTNCGAWNSIVEEAAPSGKLQMKRAGGNAVITKLSEVSTENEYRIKTNIEEFDRVLGGGIIPGSLILIGGDPGIGKSTLTLQMTSAISNHNPLYITGEESLRQIKFRANRLKNVPDDLELMAETNIETINYAIKNSDSDVIIVDSIQSVYSEKIEATPGSVAQVRECAALLMQTAKTTGKSIIIIGHVTKEGALAGPKILEHMVDTVLQFEGDKTYSYRIIRSLKNRYGSTNEIGIFDMGENGLNEVKNPSEIFLSERHEQASGTAIVATIEGARPILLEIQALVTQSNYAQPQRSCTGIDIRRLHLIVAALEKRLGIPFRQQDIFVNVAGGVYLNDPAADLGVAAALISSQRDIAINNKMALIGEIGLTGEVRSVSQIEKRIQECQKLGFKTAAIPMANSKKLSRKFDIEILPVQRVSLLLSMIF